MKKIVFLIVLLVLIASLIACQSAPGPPSVEPPAPTEEPKPTEPPTPPETPSKLEPPKKPEKEEIITHSSLGLILVKGNERTFSYGVGEVLNPEMKPPLFEFPIYVSTFSQGKHIILAIISDPNLEIGDEWETLVKNPDYPNHVIKIKLIRVKEEYKYIVETSFSVDSGESWWDPLIYPFELMSSD